MRRALPLLLFGLVGCYSPGTFGSGPAGPGDYTPARYGGGWYDEPLRASVYFDEHMGFASFDVNREAHVALFALQPGGGMQMIYPAIGFGGRQQFASGYHTIRTSASSYRFASNYSLAGGTTPTYIILIASERPLDVRPFMATGSLPWLNRLAVTWNPYRATEVLASQIVPQASITDWTVAYHVIWPNGMWDYRPDYRPRYTWIQCPGNVILSVPLEAVRRGLVQCPNGEMPVDSAGNRLPEIEDALPRRPIDRGWMEAADSSDVRLRETLRRVAEKRGLPVDEVETPIPTWRRDLRPRPGRGVDEGEQARQTNVRPSLPTRPTDAAGVSERAQRPDGVDRQRGPEGKRVIPVRRSQPETRRATPRPSRPPEPVSRVEPRSRPTPQRAEPARSAPPPRATPPSRPAPKPKPRPKPKPKEGGGGGEPGV